MVLQWIKAAHLDRPLKVYTQSRSVCRIPVFLCLLWIVSLSVPHVCTSHTINSLKTPTLDHNDK